MVSGPGGSALAAGGHVPGMSLLVIHVNRVEPLLAGPLVLDQQHGVAQQEGVDQKMNHQSEAVRIDGDHKRDQRGNDEGDEDAAPPTASVD